MKNRTPDSDDIERAVYDGMQDLRAARENRGQSPISSKSQRGAARKKVGAKPTKRQK